MALPETDADEAAGEEVPPPAPAPAGGAGLPARLLLCTALRQRDVQQEGGQLAALFRLLTVGICILCPGAMPPPRKA